MQQSIGRTLVSPERFALTLERLCHQLLEDWGDFSDACIIGIQPKGTLLANRIHTRLQQLAGPQRIEYGKMDITFYRDDFRRQGGGPLAPHPNEINFLVADKKVLLVDDVLYTGRTIQAALAALQHYGRPRSVELLVLVDRRFNRQLPIQPDYVGISVDALDEAYVRVHWQETHGEDDIWLFDKK
ncbi:MAG TPA: bifunctional pyr operon transcriptional regulator/uracil phosphoribosyltransferase PyrR [Saprospiraceae bacterium]|nr:bifunctional pyr operon transcriptional regulator/uracil phosphoribosyltransferase PyrR [Saprospiraceae bacterium]HND87370.1 bifunctional pyr operon transcriptional regulator/uracil phosphoribosyltransferase PyrR [Saprospiraceae bacterium]HNG89191.1 bifunctional pyr operon transcriptional regulator/uracil phosphoribosyltransferase PyrR [Saprospiraceae bacterium]